MLRCSSNIEASTGPGSAICQGDEVIVYFHHDNMTAAKVDERRTLDCKFGAFKMKDWIGKPYGCRVVSSNQRGYVYLLAPTPELWTKALRHRTQILYAADISLISSYLELHPGSVVLESGTGSGSLTHALARAAAPGGQVHTFEFHAQRAQEAEQEFLMHGLAEFVNVVERDIEREGFPESLHGKADAVFLDLPGPWKVISSAAACLRGDGTFCAFSPCIEQVQRTCGALSQAGFYNVRTLECLLRHYETRHANLVTDPLSALLLPGQKRKRKEDDEPVKDCTTSEHLIVKPYQEARGHTGYLTFARRIVEDLAPEVLGSRMHGATEASQDNLVPENCTDG